MIKWSPLYSILFSAPNPIFLREGGKQNNFSRLRIYRNINRGLTKEYSLKSARVSTCSRVESFDIHDKSKVSNTDQIIVICSGKPTVYSIKSSKLCLGKFIS